MKARARRSGIVALSGALSILLAAPGCNVLIGADKDYHLTIGSGATTGSGTGGNGGTGAAGGAGGGSGGTTSGPCTSPGVVCGGDCVDVSQDSAHCGSCDHACGQHQGCSSGTCLCVTGYSDCGMGVGCVDLASDPANCGSCGQVCMGGCTMGQCGGSGCVLGQACNANNDCCVQQVCKANKCACGPGYAICSDANPVCIDLLSDPNNCGACGKTCIGGKQCLMGACM